MPTVTDNLLRYRPWRGEFRGPTNGSWAMARTSLFLLARRRIFWGLYALALMVFFFFFYGQYLIVWIQQQTAQQTVQFGGIPVKVSELTKFLDRLNLNGSAHTFANFIWFQGYIVMIVLALAGAVLVGNDFAHGSLPFYLSKPIGRRHYLLGKFLAIGLFLNLVTTVPAFALYLQAGLLYDWQSYYFDHLRELLGIVGYGAALTLTLGLLLIATAVWVRKTVPLIMVWTGLFVLTRLLASMLVEGANLDVRWRLIDLWNDLYLVGLWCLGAPWESARGPQPQFWEAAAACGAVIVGCMLYLRRRIQAVEIIS
ncbi:ABC transporter permease subunit [Limnoglobus roseus]|uniref:ABC transporter permease n=1 Tax=Limnoglobus roseus TaxID=2598579 RepID=A0A5C1A2M1_9BACT|nr:ABC transporter permease subunit [Limnoglobus roseus]QEL13369.1 ABC transporter permease [Limnoglobus roseus]